MFLNLGVCCQANIFPRSATWRGFALKPATPADPATPTRFTLPRCRPEQTKLCLQYYSTLHHLYCAIPHKTSQYLAMSHNTLQYVTVPHNILQLLNSLQCLTIPYKPYTRLQTVSYNPLRYHTKGTSTLQYLLGSKICWRANHFCRKPFQGGS